MTELIPNLDHRKSSERPSGLAGSADCVNTRSADHAEPAWIEATFRMTSGEDDRACGRSESWVYPRPCPGTPVIRASFRRTGCELRAKLLLQSPVPDAFRVALRFNPISFLSHHNSSLKELLAPFTQVTSVDFQVHPRGRHI